MDRKEEILKKNHAEKVMNWEKVFVQNPSIINSAYEAMDIYAEEMSIEFLKWYAVKMMEFLQYFKRKAENPIPYSIPDAYDKYIEEFEGKPIKELFQLFLQSKNKQQ